MPPHPSSERFSVPTAPEGPTSRKPGGPNMNLDSNIGEGTSNRVGNNHRYTDTFEKLREFNRSNSNSKKLWRNPNQVTPLSQIPKNETIRTTSRNTEATNYRVFGVSSQDAKSLVLEPRDIEESFDMEIRRGNISDRYSKWLFDGGRYQEWKKNILEHFQVEGSGQSMPRKRPIKKKGTLTKKKSLRRKKSSSRKVKKSRTLKSKSSKTKSNKKRNWSTVHLHSTYYVTASLYSTWYTDSS